MFYYYYDPTYLLLIIGAVISLIASARVQSTFNRYSRVSSMRGITGAQAAEMILRYNGITDVTVRRVSGNLTDHYNPMKKVVNLSDSTYGSTSVAAIGVAAHECGHVLQHAQGYLPITIRSLLVPVANFGSSISWILILAGLFIRSDSSQLLINIGIFAFSLAVLFHIVTLPVEFDASRRALKQMTDCGILYENEVSGSKKVLGAAAMTYVASAIASILQLLRLVLLFGGRRDD